jgi:hypothetical protein
LTFPNSENNGDKQQTEEEDQDVIKGWQNSSNCGSEIMPKYQSGVLLYFSLFGKSIDISNIIQTEM